MKIELYKLEKPQDFDFERRITKILDDKLDRRNRMRGKGLMRMETCLKRGKLFLMDFVKIRMDHGPAKAGEGLPVTGFELETNEGFGEETALLWDSSNDWCILQYNHYGVRASAIAEYFSLYVHDAPVNLILHPKIDDNIHSKIRAKRLVNKLSFSVAAKEISDADYDNGASLGSATKILKRTDADHIEITITARRKSRLDVDLPDFAKWLMHLGGSSEGSPVSSAHATAREDDDSKQEVLDLLHHRIVTEEDILPGIDKRYSMKDRFDALHRAHGAWKHLMT